ncbi:MAG: hypothetical protein HZB98_06905, partial [Bacteroidia bacterium]|nr:hypothetical protein [Bacteroidia bacterium]
TPEGGKVVKTPGFGKSDNIIKRAGEISLYESGTALGKLTNLYKGSYYNYASNSFDEKSDDEIRKVLDVNLRYYNFSVNSLSYKEEKTEKPSALFNYWLSINDLTVNMGNRIFFKPAIEMTGYLGENVSGPVLIQRPKIESDSVCYYLPLGYKIYHKPDNVDFNTDFGRYSFNLEVFNDRIIFRRYLELPKQSVSSERYQEFRKFINTIAKTDNQFIILINSKSQTAI